MITVRKSQDRGHFDHGWLNTYHTFSFGEYRDADHRGFRSLRVLNEDRVDAGQGFGAHPHQDMEIVTYVVAGALQHRDSLGNTSTIRPGDVQRMTAGTGVTHSEYNPSETEAVHLLQIWLFPESRGLTPGYEQRHFADDEKRGRLRLLASRDGADGSVVMHQDARLYAALLTTGEAVEHAFAAGRYGWLQVVRGTVQADEVELSAGDGAAIAEPAGLNIVAVDEAEILMFDLA